MVTPAIRVANLTKRYHLGNHEELRARYKTLRDSAADLFAAPLNRLRGQKPEPKKEDILTALDNVSFEVPVGETLGIIGRNGAGKSTLLKVLSRITEPTSGRVQRFGRMASLLEVGTGFHQELTGRENVFLNGAILGMKRREIERKFDQIVAFADVERFIDMPVKRFSSGMQMRLAFAVAAHLEPEILIIDEVLAVGDASFQRKCIDRMRELASSGCTLLFVSHNMEMVPTLCRTALWMQSGKLIRHGPAVEVTDAYLASLAGDFNDDLLIDKPRRGDGRARFRRLQVLDAEGRAVPAIRFGEDLRCVVEIDAKVNVNNVSMQIVIKSIHGTRLVSGWTDEVAFTPQVCLKRGLQRFECRFRDLPIRPGRQVAFELWMFDGDWIDWIDMAHIYDVVELEPSGISLHSDQGAVVVDYTWQRLPDEAHQTEDLTTAGSN